MSRKRSGTVARTEPALFLLLDEFQLVTFECGPVLKLLHWQKPASIRLCVRSGQPLEFREIVRHDSGGRFLGIHRTYERQYDRIDRLERGLPTENLGIGVIARQILGRPEAQAAAAELDAAMRLEGKPEEAA